MSTGAAQPARAQVESVLHSFAGPTGDGAYPDYAALLKDSKGDLFGTTGAGGNSANCSTTGCGTVFELTPDSSSATGYKETVLYNFAGGPNDGANPEAGLVADSSGNLYGTTLNAGSSSDGTVFELSPPTTAGGNWQETVLYNFKGLTANDGVQPNGDLIMDSAGNLYGTTVHGGSTAGNCSTLGCGTVFELSPPTTSAGNWQETELYLFKGYNTSTPTASDGDGPQGGLVMDSSGNLYGTTSSGGSSDSGTVFELVYNSSLRSYTEKILYNFIGGTGDGENPRDGLILDPAGNLFGTTYYGGPSTNCSTFGCGTAFELAYDSTSNSYTEKLLHEFAGGTADGAQPYAGLVMDSAGNLYGATSVGGNAACVSKFGTGCGTVFELSPPATAGGNWQETLVYKFAGQTAGDGSLPAATPILDSSGNLYGASAYGGSSTSCSTKGCGTVYGIAPVTLSASSLSFNNVEVGTTSAAQSTTVTNIGIQGLTYSGASLSGTNSADFAITSNTCNSAMAPSGTCTVSVAFTPSAAASETASLDLTEAGLTQAVSLTGTGVYPTASPSPSSLAFSSQDVGAASSAQTVTLTNSSAVTLTVSSVGVTGDFAIGTNTCTSTVAPSGKCTVGVTFKPTAGGKRTGTLSFTDNASNSPQTVALSGTGEDFSLVLASGYSDSVSVRPGEIATYMFTVTPLDGFNETVSFKCTGVPAKTLCILLPSSISFARFIGGNVFLRLSTTSPSLLPPGAPKSGPTAPGGAPAQAWWIALLMTILLGTLALASRRRRVPLLAGAVLLAALAVSCGGGGGGGSSTPLISGTPAGTYTITLTATSGTLMHKLTVQLTVL